MSSRRDRPPSGRHNIGKDKNETFNTTNYFSTSYENTNYNNNNNNNNNNYNNNTPLSSRPQSARNRITPRNEYQPNETRRMNRPVSAYSSNGNNNNNNNNNNNKKGISTSSPRIISNNHNHHNQNQNEYTLENSKESTELLVQQLRDKVELEKKRAESEKTRVMGKFNAFSRPKNSLKYPLRSALLDPEVNNYPQSKTRSELMKKIKISAIPHPSYDIDGDGWVSQEDYKLAKRFDFDGNGVIDPDEREVAKHVIAEEFFRTNSDHIRIFGDNFASQGHKENTESLEKAHCFERTLRQLRSIEEGFRSRSSKQMAQCMASETSEMTKFHYYSDKSDTIAYTDYDALPRPNSISMTQLPTNNYSINNITNYNSNSNASLQPFLEYGNMNRQPFGNTITEHHGSRRSLLNARKEQARLQAATTFEIAVSGKPKYKTQKIALISNYELEN